MTIGDYFIAILYFLLLWSLVSVVSEKNNLTEITLEMRDLSPWCIRCHIRREICTKTHTTPRFTAVEMKGEIMTTWWRLSDGEVREPVKDGVEGWRLESCFVETFISLWIGAEDLICGKTELVVNIQRELNPADRRASKHKESELNQTVERV